MMQISSAGQWKCLDEDRTSFDDRLLLRADTYRPEGYSTQSQQQGRDESENREISRITLVREIS